MKTLLFASAFFLLCAGCNRNVEKTKVSNSRHSATVPGKERPSYSIFLKQVKIQRQQLKGKPVNVAADYLYSLVNEDITAYWEGTPWDFNGTTRIPGEGTIACGYFITNVLSDLGFNIQRVKLAQQASSQMINALTVDVNRVGSIEALKAYLARQKDHSLFIVGLDFHTGFIIKTEKDCYFLHANYIGRQGVVKEAIEHSRALAASKSFMIGNLSANGALLTKWSNL